LIYFGRVGIGMESESYGCVNGGETEFSQLFVVTLLA
jgi:hypothetical protein